MVAEYESEPEGYMKQGDLPRSQDHRITFQDWHPLPSGTTEFLYMFHLKLPQNGFQPLLDIRINLSFK